MMFWVEFGGDAPESRGLEDGYGFLPTHIHRDVASVPFRLTITNDPEPRLFSVDRERGVFVSTHQSDGICRYAGIERNTYFRLCALLARVQWRALELNPLLVEEDLSHQVPSRCLFAPQQFKEDFALVLEDPTVCHGCMEFYHCLAAEAEIMALQTLLTGIRAARG